MRGSVSGRRTALISGLAATLVLTAAALSQAALHVNLVSRNSHGTAANGDSTTEGGAGTISGDGRLVAFASKAANLPDGNGSTYEAYVRNLATGKTRLVSTDKNGNPAAGGVFNPAISADGRFVVFDGVGNGLPGANPPYTEVWVHDLKTGKTQLASKANDGSPGDRNSSYPSVSADGRFVAFQSNSGNLPDGDGTDIFAYVRDLKRGKTILVSQTKIGSPAYGQMYGQSVSSDGDVVVFQSTDIGLPHGDGSTTHVYARELRRGKTLLVDRTPGGHVANAASYDSSVSGNGHLVAFDSYATNLPGGNGQDQVFLRDIGAGTTKLVSRNSAGHRQNGQAYYGHPSGDGRYVAFEASAKNLPGGNGSTTEVYGRDVRAGKTVLLSRAPNGDPANAYCDYPSISLDGDWAAFYSGATNLGGNTSYSNVFRAGPIG